MKEYIAENDRIGFVQYTHADDRDMLTCWQNHDTQKGYNYAFAGTLEDLSSIDITAFPFWVVAVDKTSGKKIGALRLSSGKKPRPRYLDLSQLPRDGLWYGIIFAGS